MIIIYRNKILLYLLNIGGSYEINVHVEKPKMLLCIQSWASYLLQGFEDNVMGSSPGRLADTVITYCPGRPSKLTWKKITKP